MALKLDKSNCANSDSVFIVVVFVVAVFVVTVFVAAVFIVGKKKMALKNITLDDDGYTDM